MIRFLHELTTEEVGGKANGLKRLREIGMNVPDAFVIIQPGAQSIDEELLKRGLARLGSSPKAVRSSAVSEDGAGASFAGQFESYLGLETFSDIRDAIQRCIAAAGSDRVKGYAGNITPDADLRISVILQNMVNARVAGVVFSVNPVNNRRDKLMINAVAGLGEDLVSGKRDAHHYEVFKSGSNISSEASKNGHLLNTHRIREIVEGAKRAEEHYGQPVDLEWAIDHNDTLFWLQVRPVTTLQREHYNELDTVQGDSTEIWTLGNIGEMMPGVATPLTYSVSVEAIDYGMTMLADKAGAFKLSNRTGKRYIQMFYNRLFVNMSHMMDYPKNVWMNTPEDVQFALSGKVFQGIEAKVEAPLPKRVFNFFKQIRNTARAKKHLEDLTALAAGFSINTQLDMASLHDALGTARQKLGEGFGHHLMTSAQSGTLYSAFMRIMTDNKRQPDAGDHHIATMLLLNIPEIESADAVKSLERFARTIREQAVFAEKFINAPPQIALEMLQHSGPEEITTQFAGFLKRHGHRCVRESELREKTWADQPKQLIQTLQTRVRLGEVKHVNQDTEALITEALSHLPLIKRVILRQMVPIARNAVARREISKALSIKMVSIIRNGYQRLAEKMVHEGLLADVDQIYFLTHEEIGMLLKDQDGVWIEKANRRREILPELDKLVFEEICYGKPEPIEHEPTVILLEGQLKGIPVSGGVVEGRARIIHSLEDAEKLKEGEIMVASFTDIGWTPYFSIIGGLITEIGSPLSHGAVVAREYGIPAIVAAKGARGFLSDGEMVRLDGNLGVVERV